MPEEKIIQKLLEHDEKFGQMDAKIDRNHTETLDKLDGIITIVQRLDQERLFTFEYVKRLQKDVDKVKKILKIS